MVTLPGSYSEGERSLHSTRPRVLCRSRSVLLPSPRALSAYRIYALLVHGHLAAQCAVLPNLCARSLETSLRVSAVQHTTHTWHYKAHLTRNGTPLSCVRRLCSQPTLGLLASIDRSSRCAETSIGVPLVPPRSTAALPLPSSHCQAHHARSVLPLRDTSVRRKQQHLAVTGTCGSTAGQIRSSACLLPKRRCLHKTRRP